MHDEDIHHRHKEPNGDIIEMHFQHVAVTASNPEGVSYSCVYIRNNERLIGYDNFEGHAGMRHHKHVRDRIVAYSYLDEWTLFADFVDDVDKVRRGVFA